MNRERRRQGIKEQYEFKLQCKDGRDLWALISTTPLEDDKGQYVGALAMLADITDRKQAEDNILKLNTELEQRVVERTTQLELANKELEAFSYSVSHDLRTPLRAIDGFSQALLEDYSDKLDSEGQSYLQRVRAASQRMAELIDDLLDLSRVSRAEMGQETVDLSLLAQQIINDLRKADGTRTVSFTAAENLKAMGDSHLLRVALENLLGNAWKFTQKQANAEIEFGATVREDGQTAYYIRDNGAGFDMHYASKLFGAFQRLHAANDFPGTGIGLATVQRIIHRHGGTIWAEGAVDQGATFYFTL
jgi:light-regulated signal transduction histidine kinase (bacteriophytochrome)